MQRPTKKIFDPDKNIFNPSNPCKKYFDPCNPRNPHNNWTCVTHVTHTPMHPHNPCDLADSFYTHAEDESGCCNGSGDIDCQRDNLTRVTSKISTSHPGQL